MDERRRVLYRERTGWSWWLNLLLFGAVGGALLGPVLVGGAAPEPMAWAFTLGLGGLIYLLLGGLTVVLEPDRLRVGLGSGRPFGTTIALDDIEELESVEYRPLRDFGGWGFRGTRDRRIWSARGNRAVRLTLRDDRVVYIGSDQPRTLENRIRGAMGPLRTAGT
jgi:hypothetical protein